MSKQEKMHKVEFIIIVSIVLSAVTFICSHIVFGVEYVLKYFVSVFLVSMIPMWIVLYYGLRKIYEYYFFNCLTRIFNIKKDKAILNRIFGINHTNVAITLLISIFIMSCLVYFGENGIIIIENNLNSRVYCYLWAGVPFVCGSFAGVIAIRAINEARFFLKSKINVGHVSEHVVLLRKLKMFLDIAIVVAYFVCISMYSVVLVGPQTGQKMQQPLILFLVFMAVWPLIIHIFCRVYMQLVREKCFREKYKNMDALSSEQLKEEIKKRKYITRLFTGYNVGYKNYSLVLSFLLSFVQIVLTFLGD